MKNMSDKEITCQIVNAAQKIDYNYFHKSLDLRLNPLCSDFAMLEANKSSFDTAKARTIAKLEAEVESIKKTISICSEMDFDTFWSITRTRRDEKP